MTSALERKARVDETARLLALGLSQKQIADQVGVHPRTVADYAAGIREDATKATRAQRRKEEPRPHG